MELIGWLFSLSPRSFQLFLGRMLGRVLKWKKFRQEVVDQNLGLAYPTQNEAFRSSIRSKSYEAMGHLIVEILLLFGPFRKFILANSRINGVEHWVEAKKRGKGVIFISSHVGNWEVMAATGAIYHGIDIMIVTKHLKPQWIHKAVERARARCGVAGTYEPRTLKDVLRSLGKNGTVGFVMDQYSGPPVGVRVPVFGVPVGTPAAIAALAKRTGATVLPVVSYRDCRGKFTVDIHSELRWETNSSPQREIAINTARFAARLEKDIYDHPDQWLWTHRRFKGELGPLREGEWDEGRTRH
jgi:KDO2-lipid IV(A) lauroyltransferase